MAARPAPLTPGRWWAWGPGGASPTRGGLGEVGGGGGHPRLTIIHVVRELLLINPLRILHTPDGLHGEERDRERQSRGLAGRGARGRGGGGEGGPAHLRVGGGGGGGGRTAAALRLVHQRGLEVGQVSLREGVLGDFLLLLPLVLEGQHLVRGPQVVPAAAAQLRHFPPAAPSRAAQQLSRRVLFSAARIKPFAIFFFFLSLNFFFFFSPSPKKPLIICSRLKFFSLKFWVFSLSFLTFQLFPPHHL